VDGPPPADALGELRETRCELAVQYDCVSSSQCNAKHADPIASMFEKLEGASFNTECFNDVIDAMEQYTGGGTYVPSDCTLFEGDVRDGERCVGYYGLGYRAHNCEPGLRCTLDAGADFARCGPGIIAANDTQLAENCDPAAVVEMCTSSLYCKQGDNVCVYELEDGDPCFQETACSVISYCQGRASGGEGVCTLQLDLGEACDVEDDRKVCAFACDEDSCRRTECVDDV